MAYLNSTTPQQYYEEGNYNNYQFISLKDIVDQFIVTYIGQDKIINSARRNDVAFHAQRALAELSFDTFKSCKSQEIVVPPSLQMILPQDYVNYTAISWVDSAGIKHRLYPTLGKTSNPTSYYQDSDGDFHIEAKGSITTGSDQLVLNSQYNNVYVGMMIKAPFGGIDSLIVDAISVSNNITTITMSDTATETFSDMPIQFVEADGSLIQNNQTNILTQGNTVGIGDTIITGSSAAAVSGVIVGMHVSSEHFPVGTKVTGVSGAVIFVDEESITGGISEDIGFTLQNYNSTTWNRYKTHVPSENNNDDYEVDNDIYDLNVGQRYGLDPSHAQINGSYYIDCVSGKIHFSSNVSGKTVVLDYISDTLGTDNEMQVHKFAEEAMYKYIAHAILASKANVPEYLVARFKKERFAEVRKAKLRLSNIKLEEITQVLRNKSKWIKH